jgi:hypothetical protein
MRNIIESTASVILCLLSCVWGLTQVTSHLTAPATMHGSVAAGARQGSVNRFGTSGIVLVDGVAYKTVQAAIDSLPATGGVVYVPPGTYTGPTIIPSNVHIEGYAGLIPSATLNGNSRNHLAMYPAFPADQQTVFTYTSDLILLDIANASIRYVTLDFQGNNAGLILSASSYNRFDITIRNCGKGTGLTLTTPRPGPTAGSTAQNYFERLHVFNVGKGITLTADPRGASASADNYFGLVQIDDVSVLGLETIQFCDSNYFARLHISGLANSANGVIINNSSTPEVDTDAGGQAFAQLLIDPAAPDSYTGTILTLNNSRGTQIGQFASSTLPGHGTGFSLRNANATYTFGLTEDFSGTIPMGTLETSFLNLSGPTMGSNGLALMNARTSKWSLYRGRFDEFELDDMASADAGKHRISITTQGASVLNSKGTAPIGFNTGANSGTGGLQFGSGGKSPSVVASMDATGQLSKGTTNYTLTVGTGSVTTAGTAVAALTCQAETGTSVTGALTTDAVVPNIGAALPPTWQTGIVLSAHVTAANTITVYLCNPTAGSITPAPTQVNVRVLR